MSKLPYAGFVPGSDKGETRAEPKIWAEMDKFNAAASKMQEEMVKLNAAAKGGNLDAIKAAVGDTGKSCTACHDDYRKEQQQAPLRFAGLSLRPAPARRPRCPHCRR